MGKLSVSPGPMISPLLNPHRSTPGFLSVIFSLVLFIVIAPRSTPGQSPPPAAPESRSASAASQDAATQAAERRRKFQEDEQRLENGEVNHEDTESAGDTKSSGPEPTLFISPAVVGMLANQEQRFTLFDRAGHNLTSKAEWSLSNSYVADLTPGVIPSIRAKDHGTVTLRASIGGESAEAQIKVYPGDRMPIAAILWQAPKIPGYTTNKIVQAVPTANGPDLYSVDQNADGSTLIRAVRADGQQIWMKEIAPPSSKPSDSKDAQPGPQQ